MLVDARSSLKNHASWALAPWYDGQIAAAQDPSNGNWQHAAELPVARVY
jgi:hypothetical protein